ncbi:hypothetical protein KDH_54100 [Dictyobacter sp. S3.2.2.5]|uniref:Uncharacterized protein n=1 Tax=Dictyobacter halimunensis TaxID=3026934 RepID=A0ABQ6G0F9_9CHLR|nr:hypothetical protein KDH_54100 [Dictyobacter sp. S3.2.2.5]
MDMWIKFALFCTEKPQKHVFYGLIHTEGGVFPTYPQSYPPKKSLDVDNFVCLKEKEGGIMG